MELALLVLGTQTIHREPEPSYEGTDMTEKRGPLTPGLRRGGREVHTRKCKITKRSHQVYEK